MITPEDAAQVVALLGYGICLVTVVWGVLLVVVFIDQLRKGRK